MNFARLGLHWSVRKRGQISFTVEALLKPRGKAAFLRTIQPDETLLDVGCGNESPFFTKYLFPHIRYFGIDVVDCSERSRKSAERFILATPESFAADIATFRDSFDAVVSSHNIEHCNDLVGVMLAMLNAIRPGGRIYLAFPSESSAHFPKRDGCLNFFDDSTHQRIPDYSRILEAIRESGFAVEYETPRYRPLVPFLVGLLLEPISALRRRRMVGTWALYGFESVVWARKPSTAARP